MRPFGETASRDHAEALSTTAVRASQGRRSTSGRVRIDAAKAAIASCGVSAWTASVCPEPLSHSWTVAAIRARPARTSSGDSAGFVASAQSRQNVSRSVAASGNLLMCCANQNCTAGASSSHSSRSSASYARTSSHFPSFIRSTTQSVFPCQIRGVTKMNVDVCGSIPRGSAVRVS